MAAFGQLAVRLSVSPHLVALQTMKTTVLTAGIVLLVLALSYSLVRLDILDAEFLRFLPPLLALVVAAAIIFGVLRAKRAESTHSHRPKKKG